MGLAWDMLQDPPPALPRNAVILHLAAVLQGPPDALALNAAMVLPLVKLARQSEARAVLFASTAAVYAPGPMPCRETGKPAPPGAYGLAKLQAEQALQLHSDIPSHILRIGNIPGIDALLGPRKDNQPILLDPVPGQTGGPVRSWIGPQDLAHTLAQLCTLPLPPILNLAADPPLAMADLLAADDRPWRYGPPRDGVLPRITLDTSLLQALIPMPVASAPDLAAQARWARSVLQ